MEAVKQYNANVNCSQSYDYNQSFMLTIDLVDVSFRHAVVSLSANAMCLTVWLLLGL